MKLTKDRLKQIIKEELEEMMGQPSTKPKDPQEVEALASQNKYYTFDDVVQYFKKYLGIDNVPEKDIDLVLRRFASDNRKSFESFQEEMNKQLLSVLKGRREYGRPTPGPGFENPEIPQFAANRTPDSFHHMLTALQRKFNSNDRNKGF